MIWDSQQGFEFLQLNSLLPWTHELFHDNRRKFKSMDFYQWICDIQIIWKLSYLTLLRFIVFNSLNTELCCLYCFFLYWFFPYDSQSNQITKLLFSNLGRACSNLYLCWRGPLKSVLFVCPSVCLSVDLWTIFLRIYPVGFLNFLDEDILSHLLKSDKARFCLDNWVNEKK